jgi:hypothetical protein
MSQNKYLHVKCYLFPNDIDPTTDDLELANEIRRFPLTITAGGLYDTLVKTLSLAYQEFLGPGDTLKTFWLDEEDELISFSSEKEMQFAIETGRKMTVNEDFYLDVNAREDSEDERESDLDFIFRVYVSKQKASLSNRSQTVEKEIEEEQYEFNHIDSQCSYCKAEIKDMGYKCTICKNYRLCAKCRINGIHLEHIFVRIIKK